MTLCSECGSPLAEWQERKGHHKCLNCYYGLFGKSRQLEMQERHLGEGKYMTAWDYLDMKRKERENKEKVKNNG